MTTRNNSVWAGIENVKLQAGCGSGMEGQACAMQEARRRNGLDPKSDACPESMDPIIHKLIITANDAHETGRKALPALLPKAWNTRISTEVTERRAMRCVTEAFRTLEGAFRAAKLGIVADKFRNFPEIRTKQDLKRAEVMGREAEKEANASAASAADAAANAAAYSAANAAAYAAAYAAASAAYAANAAYASYAASAAANAAANAAYASYAAYASAADAAAAGSSEAKAKFCLALIEEFCAEEHGNQANGVEDATAYLQAKITPKTDKAAKIWKAEQDLISLRASLAMFSARAHESANQANAVEDRIRAVENALAELKKPDLIKHGDYGRTDQGNPRVFAEVGGKIAAFDNSNHKLCYPDANEFQGRYNTYTILGNVFEDMAKKT